ncbi:hypothetical protein PENFLA_c017G05499 [Penicillium flavigenum]|uniref:Uncharacterized protein n=1 Tax=Penicillium flavigenum TaxID=254877 RepID=A0A1V6T1X0_9EURO|nr:hypothetical protein PENFLA_c017G05499 [Penicillium flavigenum]
MSDKQETPPTNQPPAAPTTSNKVGKRQRQRPRGRKKIRRKELEKVLVSGADAASGAAPASSAGPESSTPPAASSAAFTSAPMVSPFWASPTIPLLLRWSPNYSLTDEETTALAGYLLDIITAFVQGRRLR